MTSELILVPPGAGRPIPRLHGETTVLKATTSETAGAYAVRENFVPAGLSGVPMHIHRTAEEAFYVLDGVMTVYTDAGSQEAPAGSFVLIPRGVVHSLANRTTAPLRWLTLISPAWVSRWIEAEAELVRDAGGTPDPGAQAALYARYGLEIVGPAPGD
jgi:quercetin dioxygenase-like cupin family protein